MPSKTFSISSGTLFIQSWAVAGLPQSLGLATRPYGSDAQITAELGNVTELCRTRQSRANFTEVKAPFDIPKRDAQNRT